MSSISIRSNARVKPEVALFGAHDMNARRIDEVDVDSTTDFNWRIDCACGLKIRRLRFYNSEVRHLASEFDVWIRWACCKSRKKFGSAMK